MSILAVLVVALSSAARAGLLVPPCPAPWSALLSKEVFGRHALKALVRRSPSVPPDVRSGQAHYYRTAIRAVAKGADFAGHCTIVRIGCGATTACLAIADTLDGKVFFPRELVGATALLVDSPDQVDIFNYRVDSRLFVVVGIPNEDAAREGASYFIWQNDRLRLIRFISAATLCSMPPSKSN